MSKVTFFKRTALTAVVALGLGMLSISPSTAKVQSHTITIDSATDSIAPGETASAVVTHSFNRDKTNDSVTVSAAVTSGLTTSAGTLRFMLADSSTSGAASTLEPQYFSNYNLPGNDASSENSGGTNQIQNCALGTKGGSPGDCIGRFSPSTATVSTNISETTTADNTNIQITTKLNVYLVAPSQPGTYVVTMFTRTYDELEGIGANSQSNGYDVTGPTVTWTITVTAPSKVASTYTSVVRTGTTSAANGTDLATDSSTVASTTSSSVAPKFTIWTNLNNQLGTDQADTAEDSITVTVSGPAILSAESTNNAGGTGSTSRGALKALTLNTDEAPDANGTPVYVWSDGNAGTATVTFTAVNSALTWTKTLTFHGSGSKIALGTSRYKIAQAGGYTTGSTSSPFFTVTLKDSADRAVPGQSLTVTSSNNAVATGSCADAIGAVTDGTYGCSVTTIAGSTSGQTATLTVTYEDAAGTEFSVNYVISLGGSVASVVLTTDKANYEPGEKMVVTATAKDSAGNPVYDGLAGPSLSANKALGSTLTMNAYIGGVSTSKTRSSSTGLETAADTLYAPAASGKFTISGLAGDAAATPISVTATVTDDAATAAASAATDAALEAIDAANAATDAANLAAEAADAATVAAEEARDAADAATAAVEALATEVATLMAALKAQITTLANTVAKIAKKVKA